MATQTEQTAEEKLAKLNAYLDQALALFERDPPDSLYQDGYLACLKNVRREGLGDPAP